MWERSIASRTRNKARASLAAVALFAATAALPASGQDAQAGAKKSAPCQTCHGKDGLGTLPDAPHLAGQPAIYLERALKAYRSGERTHPSMRAIADSLSDKDIANLAAYYAQPAVHTAGK